MDLNAARGRTEMMLGMIREDLNEEWMLDSTHLIV